mmetsp:Transcript_11076/g.12183  ORF Transcript_11076/g.12183 Transcript_11076/m.12183 type:complete len:223 (+) Transcript_11076:2-670(+)
MAQLYESFQLYVSNEGSKPKQVQMGECVFLLGGRGEKAQEALVTLTTKHADGKRVVNLDFKDSQNKSYIPLGHSLYCPMRDYQYQIKHSPDTVKPLDPTRCIRVGVTVLIEHSGHVLITRRASHLRTFPEKWVMPGGHVDKGETFEQAGIREVLEETGLHVKDLKLCGLWESCYPTFLKDGVPRSQHLVVMYKASLSDEHAKQYPCKNIIKLEERDRRSCVD